MDLRFDKKHYLNDIQALRAEIARNGAAARITPLTLSHPAVDGKPTVYLNLAYQPQAGKAKADASLYVVGFANANATSGWRFDLPSLAALAGMPTRLLAAKCDGNYIRLGHSDSLPDITDQGLATYLMRLAKYDGGDFKQELKTALAAIMVAVSEAARFATLAQGVDAVLGSDGRYVPPIDVVRNWGGHTLGA